MSARTFAACVLLLAAIPALGQEFEIFDENDFVDPRERGAAFTAGGTGQTHPGVSVVISRALLGHVRHYQWRNSRKADAEFAHFNTSFYWASSQLNLKLTTFRDRGESARLPSYRGTFQYGWYFVTGSSPEEAKQESDDAPVDDRASGRVLVTLTMEENAFRDDRHRDRFLYESGIETTAKVKGVRGTATWMRRRIDESKSVDRFTYFYRWNLSSSSPITLNAAAGTGVERNDGWHWAARAVVSGVVKIPKVQNITLNFSYAPTYLPGNRTRSFYNEFAVYLDVPLVFTTIAGRKQAL